MTKSYQASDRLRARLVGNNVVHIEEHLEAMQRDPHGLEFEPWKREVDDIWRRTFESINSMSEKSQPSVLQYIKETWVTYITHYGVIDQINL